MNDADYKRGVEDALTLPFIWIGTYTAEYLKEQIAKHRKKLLTRKVTKWFFVYKSSGLRSRFYDTEDAAFQGSLNSLGNVDENVLGGPYSAGIEESL